MNTDIPSSPEPHAFRLAVHLDDDMVKPIVRQLVALDYHTVVKGSETVLLLPCENEGMAKARAAIILSMRALFSRLINGVAIEKYALSDGETLDRTWLA